MDSANYDSLSTSYLLLELLTRGQISQQLFIHVSDVLKYSRGFESALIKCSDAWQHPSSKTVEFQELFN